MKPTSELEKSIFSNGGMPFIRVPNGKDIKLATREEDWPAGLRGTMPTAEPTIVNNIRDGSEVKNEADPNGFTQHTPGAKMDAGKPPVFQGVMSYFPRALKAVSMVSYVGAKKYAWKGWESVPDGFNRYSDALGRHLVAETIEGPIDSDTKQLHAAQVAWNALARLELYLRDEESK